MQPCQSTKLDFNCFFQNGNLETVPRIVLFSLVSSTSLVANFLKWTTCKNLIGLIASYCFPVPFPVRRSTVSSLCMQFQRSDRYQFLCLPQKALVLGELGQPVTLVSTVIVRFGECIRYYRLLPLTRRKVDLKLALFVALIVTPLHGFVVAAI